MRFVILLLIGWCCLGNSYAKTDPQALYWVNLKDKANSPYSLLFPQQYLSSRAIERRQKQGIPIDESDLPVNPEYWKAVENCGAKVRHQSKWLNALTVVADSLSLEKIKALDCVREVEYVGRYYPRRVNRNSKTKSSGNSYEALPGSYGYSDHQIGMLNGQMLHYFGFRGKDILVAILDGGFIGANSSPFFDSIRNDQQWYQGYDFVDVDRDVFEASTHGTMVLSTMAANLPGLMIGSAPDASYVCIKTEDTRGEYLMEECNWVAGAEYADSLGADIINSSLGYTTFSDTSMNYKYDDLNGLTSRASRSADIAFSKGMLVVNSVGNSGDDAWKYLGTPADAFYTLAIGATDYQGRHASFSSYGPTADGRVKPNISAMGQNIAVGATQGYEVIGANGTSFSSPLVAGMIASLWSAFPDYDNEAIFQLVQTVGSNFPNADDKLGFGIPDFLGAFLRESIKDHLLYLDGQEILPVISPDKKQLNLIILPDPEPLSEVRIKDAFGRQLWSKKIKSYDTYNLNIQTIPESIHWPEGLYSIEMNRRGRNLHLLVYYGGR